MWSIASDARYGGTVAPFHNAGLQSGGGRPVESVRGQASGCGGQGTRIPSVGLFVCLAVLPFSLAISIAISLAISIGRLSNQLRETKSPCRRVCPSYSWRHPYPRPHNLFLSPFPCVAGPGTMHIHLYLLRQLLRRGPLATEGAERQVVRRHP